MLNFLYIFNFLMKWFYLIIFVAPYEIIINLNFLVYFYDFMIYKEMIRYIYVIAILIFVTNFVLNHKSIASKRLTGKINDHFLM